MIKRDYFSFFALLLAASLTLTACDSNEDLDSDVIVPVISAPQSVTENDPVVDVIRTAAASSFAGVIGDNVTVTSNTSDIVQITAPASSNAAAVTATIAPLVNANGVETGATIVVIQTSNSSSPSQFVTQAPSLVSSNIRIDSQDASGNTIRFTFDTDAEFLSAAFIAGSASGQFTSAYAQRLNDVLSRVPRFAYDLPAAEGASNAAEALIAAIAAGKRAHWIGGAVVAGAVVIENNNDDSDSSAT